MSHRITMAQREIATLRERNDELEAIFDLQEGRLEQVREKWKLAHPEQPCSWPDLGAMLEWVLEATAAQGRVIDEFKGHCEGAVESLKGHDLWDAPDCADRTVWIPHEFLHRLFPGGEEAPKPCPVNDCRDGMVPEACFDGGIDWTRCVVCQPEDGA